MSVRPTRPWIGGGSPDAEAVSFGTQRPESSVLPQNLAHRARAPYACALGERRHLGSIAAPCIID
jgi:hypothetical protein